LEDFVTQPEIRAALLAAFRADRRVMTGQYSLQSAPRVHEFAAVADGDPLALWSAFYDLVRAGIIVPGNRYALEMRPGLSLHGQDLYGFPSFSLTRFGASVLSADEAFPLPLEGDAYVASITKRFPGASEVIMRYVSEAAATFSDGRYLAAAVLVGVAAEELIEGLYMSFDAHLPAEKREEFNRKLKQRRWASERFNVFLSAFDAHKGELTDELRRRIDSYLETLVNILKTSRDDVGHGRPTRVDREIAYMTLVAFPVLAGTIHELESAFGRSCAVFQRKE
jgi:hypothetical protein